MVLIHGTNIVVDDFKTRRTNPKAYIYFLTHFHRDAYQGISNLKGNERIYCSEPTRKLLVSRFPHLKNVESLDLEKTNTIFIDLKKTIYIEVTFFDSNHCVGSVMILFSGYMGTVLHTGHFRYTPKMLTDLKQLYPPNKRNSGNNGISIPIDELILDNTFCDPIFTFPRRNEAFRSIIKVIEKNPQGKYCVALDTLGKEELLVHLAKHFKIKVVVDQEKYDILTLIDYYVEFFTLETEASFLRVIKKDEIQHYIEEGSVVFVPTGWANDVCVETGPNEYVVGYSLHSNYKELSDFVKSIRPAKLCPQIDSRTNKFSLKRLNKTPLNKFQRFRNMEQNGLTILARDFCDHLKLSEDYRTLLDIEILAAIQKELGLDKHNPYNHPISKGAPVKNGKGKKKVSQQESEMLESIEIEEDIGSEDEEEAEEMEEEEEESQQRLGAARPGSDDKELWHQFYSKDINKFGGEERKGDVDDQELLKVLGNPSPDYVPFSDLSDTQETPGDFEEELQMGINEPSGLWQEEEISKFMETEKAALEASGVHRIFSGMMTLAITQKQKGETSELKEGFSMYTNQDLGSQYAISKDMNLQDVAPFSEVEKFLKKISKSKGSMILGWVESERPGPDSLFAKLANHMKKRQIVRRCQVDGGRVVYFLHESQVGQKIHDTASMVFFMVNK